MVWNRACYATLLVGVHLFAAACSPDAPEANSAAPPGTAPPSTAVEPRDDGKLVLALGDSLYAGYGLAAHESFPAQLEAALRRQKLSARVHNAGVSGDTSAAGRDRLAFTLAGLPRKPDLAIVGLGGNDMLRGVDPGATQANLLAICTELRRQGISVLLTGMLAAPNLGEDYGRKFNSIFPDVAKQCGASLDPFFLEGAIGRGDRMLPDGIHPNAAGIAHIVSRVEPLVQQELRRKARS